MQTRSPGSSMTSNWTPRPSLFRWLLLAALLPFAAVVISRWADAPSELDGDYAQYLLHAKAIAESRPYSDIGYIYTRMNLVGPRLQPPGWPMVLAPFVAVFGTHSPVFKVLVSLLVAAFGVTAGVYLARRFGAVAGIAAAVMVPLAMETQYATGSVLSDPLFCLIVWVALLVADTEHPPTWRRGILLAALCAAAVSVRVAGIALPPALMLHAIVRWRKDGLKVVAPIVALGVAGLAVGLTAIESIPFFDRILASLRNLASLPRAFVSMYTQAVATSTLYPLWSNHANDVYHGMVAVPLLVGGILFLRRHALTAAGCFLLVYVSMLVISPVREPRYAWPLYPLIAVWLVTGMLWLAERFPRFAARPAVPKFVLGSVGLVATLAAVQLVKAPARPTLLGDPDTVSLFGWLKATGDTTKLRVVFTNPRVLTLETGIPAMGIPFGVDTAVVGEFSRNGITHVVVPRARITRQSERNLGQLVTERPTQFPTVFTNPSHDVHRFVPRPEASMDSGTRSPD